MPETAEERAKQDAELAAAENAIRKGRKRKRDTGDQEELVTTRAENRQLVDRNAFLEEQLREVRARLYEAEAALENQEVDRHPPAEPGFAELLARITNQDTLIVNQTTEIRTLKRTIDEFSARNRAEASSSEQQRVTRPIAQPESSRDDLTPGREQYSDIRTNGLRPPVTRWFRHPIEVARPGSNEMGKFVRNGGLPNQGENKYIVPPGVIVAPHRALLAEGQLATRPSTPVDERPEPVYYDTKVYYHIAASNVTDARKLGLKFEGKQGAAWQDVAAFERDRGLWYCADEHIDRTKLSHLTQRNITNGDFLKPGVLPSAADQIIMKYRDRSSRGR